MSETAIQVADPQVTVPAVARAEKPVTDKQAKLAMMEAKFDKLKPLKIRAVATTGRFIEQEGEHHMARAYLANAIEEFLDDQQRWEKLATKAKGDGNEKAEAMYYRLVAYSREQVAKIAMNLNRTRRKIDPGEGPGPNVPTMPPRSVITNNTQINVNPPKPPEPNGNPA
jgi:hypothetical protein